jgi:hypothetical protein
MIFKKETLFMLVFIKDMKLTQSAAWIMVPLFSGPILGYSFVILKLLATPCQPEVVLSSKQNYH